MLVLASASPRRGFLLSEWGYDFEVVRPAVDECWPPDAGPEAGTIILAERKAAAGWLLWEKRGGGPGDVILSADTVVTLDGRVFGKPADGADAERMLTELSGRTHKVVTGFALMYAEEGGAVRVACDCAVSMVRFHKLTAAQIRAYVAGGESLDKAGAYACQGEGRKLVRRIDGSQDNVIGLPMEKLLSYLSARGIYPADRRREPPARAESSMRKGTARRAARSLRPAGRRIADLPTEIKPRERAVRSGVRALSNGELLAILLRVGTPGENVLQLAERILTESEGLRGLAKRALPELINTRGVGQAKAVLILAALELGRRAADDAEIKEKAFIRQPADAVALLKDMRDLDREHFRVLTLNTKNMVLGIETVSVGTLNTSVVHPRECFKPALRRGANAVILAHNHPSGDPSPSNQDIEITQRLVECGKILGINVLDHIIIGDKNFISLKESGDLR